MGVVKAHPDPWVFEEEIKARDWSTTASDVAVAQFFREMTFAHRFHPSLLRTLLLLEWVVTASVDLRPLLY